LTEENENSRSNPKTGTAMSFNLSMSQMNASPNSKDIGIGLLTEQIGYVGQTS
jgi:hypothetical protein